MRLDKYLSEKNNVSRTKAQALIELGRVTVDGKTVTKASFDVPNNASVETAEDETMKYVSRGGLKLEKALDFFRPDIEGKICIDVGASTGGFTDCLLQYGAAKVYAVDAGTDQLSPKLLSDSRVVSIEKFNARNLAKDMFDDEISIAVADLSFISQTYVIKNIFDVLSDSGIYIGLIKPQFELEKNKLGKGGIVKNPAFHKEAIDRVTKSLNECGFHLYGIIPSPVTGGDGNIEFLLYSGKGLANPLAMIENDRERTDLL